MKKHPLKLKFNSSDCAECLEERIVTARCNFKAFKNNYIFLQSKAVHYCYYLLFLAAVFCQYESLVLIMMVMFTNLTWNRGWCKLKGELLYLLVLEVHGRKLKYEKCFLSKRTSKV